MPKPYETTSEEMILIAEAAYKLAVMHSLKSPSDIATEVVTSIFGDDNFGVSLIPKNDTKKERVSYLSQINVSTKSLIDALHNAGEHLHVTLESKSDNVELEDTEWHRIHINDLIKDLRTLLLCSQEMFHEENEKQSINVTRNEYRKKLVSTLYEVFIREKGKSSKFAYDPVLNSYSGDFFKFLKAFYKIIDLDKGDSGIAQDIKRFI
ncbi:MAG: hypothetical protein KZQ73_11900 [Candidatus Thiodiazotropha sp. (ex Semelilucina semeliformis)]|nr:hypothetical protein [Candidatus Thiodiazotropha sp. (ex Semelilucina semeliformis)]